MNTGFLCLLPALVTIGVALRSHRIWLALACGVLSGIALVPTPLPLTLMALFVATAGDPERLKIVVFILLVGGLLEVLAVSGASDALADALEAHLDTPRRARMATWALSMCLFFDDYANVLVTGSAMRPVAQRQRVRPALVAYLVDVVAVLASVMLVSTWAAFEGATMAREAASRAAPGGGAAAGASALFLASLPYHFYTYLAIFLTLLVAWSGRWFGARFDTLPAPATSATVPAANDTAGQDARALHVLAPLLTLVLGALAGLFASGAWLQWHAGGALSLLGVLGAAPTLDVLIGATSCAILLAVYFFKRDGVLGRYTVRPAFARGVRDMLEIGCVILLATGLSHLSGQLGAGAFMARWLTHALPGTYLAAAVYTLAMLVTASTGFSWGSMAIVMPVAFSLVAQADAPQLVPVLCAAVITGAVSGEHLIPFSEKAILSATACGIPAVHHFRTHFFQSLAAFLAGGLGFVLLGHGAPLWLCLLLPATLLLAGHLALAGDSTPPAFSRTPRPPGRSARPGRARGCARADRCRPRWPPSVAAGALRAGGKRARRGRCSSH